MKNRFWSACLIGVLALGIVFSLSFSAAAKTEWKMALGDASGGTQWALGERFAKLVEAYTGGEITLALFPNGQLGSEQETVQNCRLGTLDFSVAAINNITPFSPSVGLFTLPYLILSVDEAVTLTQGPIGEELVQNTIKSAGVRILGWSYSGFRRLSNSKRAITKPEDLKGLTIRVPKNAIMIDSYKSWGVSPTPMAWDEVFIGLNDIDWGAPRGLDQNRLFVGGWAAVAPHLRVELGYLFLYVDRDDDTVGHVLATNVFVSL